MIQETLRAFSVLEQLDLYFRTSCAVLFNFAQSGHPGGSISSGRIVSPLLFGGMRYNFSNPDQPESDLIVCAAGHKALGLYAMWALRDELVQASRPDLLPALIKHRLRLEDLLGFRRNPAQNTPLFKQFSAKPLDGHPTPLTPFVKIATGASGVGVPAAFGLAMGALDYYGPNAPRVHVIEGEGGMTPGRVHEALSAAASANLGNVVLHLDWNNASIDSDCVCAESRGKGKRDKGDYVQWDPVSLLMTHGWKVFFVSEGTDWEQIIAAQRKAVAHAQKKGQPCAVVYRTEKGRGYGITGRKSHGGGHPFCSPGYYAALKEFEDTFQVQFPRSDGKGLDSAAKERLYWDTLLIFRQVAMNNPELSGFVGKKVAESAELLKQADRKPWQKVPASLDPLYRNDGAIEATIIPPVLTLEVGSKTTLRGELGNTLGHLNQLLGGPIIVSAADLLGSTSVNQANQGFPDGFFNALTNPDSRLMAVGGICEDAMGAFMSGLASYDHHIGVTASYAAFIAALEHVAARLHCIGQQARHKYSGEAYQTFLMVCGHAGLKTGEDGPTHADPQALQLLQENFPPGMCITLTPWDPQELWPLTVAGLKARPAVLAPFVTRPSEVVLDRAKLGLPPATAAISGIYQFRSADPLDDRYHGSIILQGSAVTYELLTHVLPKMDEKDYRMNVYYVSSLDLFNLLPSAEQARILPEARQLEAMGISDFTMPTLYRLVASRFGRDHSLCAGAFYPGSGTADMVLREMGLDGPALWKAIQNYVMDREINKRF
ncbi:MAG: hypothetical protein COY66_06500 [Candidatus Kerfeldbacteria bacterium CG_4_10_14_0_8_um_filter_42_10]|uniref:Transketolase-like pyrimidine-binding domain-containing protein n=1 Tax=Candidatus Kerfeldbacteria bacterium CG_4_10_14_0_8_um_filter_42_10 TaxID=2014248 RepID=A0A2M7RFR3_9BACT|nr:MAG: hypothetical protein COY66_06500 [Candidatus Kerfeldbacteria bacterium CG_4_10_14_0_8_um_filter_42_10]